MESTLAMAGIARDRGVVTTVIAPAADPYSANRVPISLAVRSRRFGGTVERMVWRGVDRVLNATHPDPTDRSLTRARDVPSALRYLRPPPSLVIVNSLRSLDLGRVLRVAHSSGVPVLWYLRETSALELLPTWAAHVDGLIANSRPLAAAATQQGTPCSFIPSFIDTAGLQPPSERTAILLVNPVASHGVDVALALARSLPAHRFVLQESWPLTDADRRHLMAAIGDLPNVELRQRRPGSEVYSDGLLLLAPHDAQFIGLSRPRTALEAQYATLPIVGTDCLGLRSVCASPELLVPPGAPPSAWVQAVELALDDYERWAAAAHRFAVGELPSEDVIWHGLMAAWEACALIAPRG